MAAFTLPSAPHPARAVHAPDRPRSAGRRCGDAPRRRRRALRWYDPEAGKELETPAEVYAAREAAEARAIEEAAAREMEASARRTAEEKLAALEARLRTLERGGPHG